MIKTAVIMAGGSGERFWPLSKQTKPKQLLNLINEDKTMLEDSIDRILDIIPAENIFIITGEKIVENIKSIVKSIPSDNIIAEPFKRNTAPCLALASAVINAKFSGVEYQNEQIITAVLTSDHVMTPIETFQNDVNLAMEYASNNKSIVTIGIVPTKAETGYGYIELADVILEKENGKIYNAKSFKEKPNLELANEYYNSGNYFWNSGMFFYDLDYFNTELNRCQPNVGGKINEMTDLIKLQSNYESGVKETSSIFEQMPDISIDYALMEKTPNVAVVKSNFKWDDLGSWDSIEKYVNRENENNIKGKAITIDAKDNIIFNYSNDKLIAVLGLDDFIIVNSDDVIMICPKDKAQDVKKIVNELKAQNKQELL